MDLYLPRIDRINRTIINSGAQALLLTDPLDIYYITGIKLSTGVVVIYDENATLFVDKRYFELCQKTSPIPVKSIEEFPITKIFKTSPFDKIEKIAFDSGKTTFNQYQELQRDIPHCTLIPLNQPIVIIRSIKDSYELDILRRAAQIGCEGYEFVVSLLKENITEIDVATELEIFWKRKGADGLGFDSIIAFGVNSSMPHYRPQLVPLKRNDPVLIDIGVKWQGYHSDMTRMVFFGEPSPKMQEIYEVVLKAQERAVEACAPGKTTGELDKIARDSIKAAGYGDLFTHGLGHGIGLEIHERPVLRSKPPESETILQPGMVITIEPGIYIPGVGGVRIEDSIIVTEEGGEVITKTPKNLRKI